MKKRKENMETYEYIKQLKNKKYIEDMEEEISELWKELYAKEKTLETMKPRKHK